MLTLLLLGRELFSTETVLSDHSADLGSQFLFARAYGFGEMAKGHLPFWNPYIYGGVPFLGDFQSALLYPPNLIFLVLPLATALNWSFALHVFLLGAAMYAWGIYRGFLRPAACLAGIAAMFGGSFFLHIFAGHLSNVCAMAWVPLIFLGIDGWLKERHGKWIGLAAAAAALQIYAGHPQYVYYTALAAGIFSLSHLPGQPRLFQAMAGLIAIYPLAALLAAAQLLPGMAAASESVRSGGVNYEFASMFSLPPENFITMLMPWFFGDMQTVPYWGRCYLWEMNLFAGTSVFLLACCGLLKKDRATIRLFVVFAAMALLALGAHTPIHRLLYEVFPGFSSFRGASKFIYFSSLIFALLAGAGFDRLLRKEAAPKALALSGLAVGALALIGGLILKQSGSGMIHQWAAAIFATKESYLNPTAFQQDALALAAQQMAGNSLLFFGSSAAVFSGFLLATISQPMAAWALGFGALLELVYFAGSSLSHFPLRDFTYQPLANFLQQNPGDYRTLNLFNPDSAMLLRSENIWGYDPTVLKRYAQLLTVSQGGEPETASQYLQFSKPNHPILNLLRCRFAFVPRPNGQIEAAQIGEPFPRFYLVSKYEVFPSTQAVLHSLAVSAYGLKEKVLLEQEPDPKPADDTGQTDIKILESSPDRWRVEVTTERPAILVMTDSYSKDWKVTPQAGSAQTNYTILPADAAIRAIPLAGGHHLFTISYRPAGFLPGLMITLLTLVGTAFLLARYLRHRPVPAP